ncbi:MAG: glycosyltransferase [Lysobacterales bacterium]
MADGSRRLLPDPASGAGAASEPIEVLIPERGRPDLLGATLSALALACAGLEVPCQIRVLVNGAAASDYRALRGAHAGVEWRFVQRPLGFHGAVAALLDRAQAPWVYLLNSDMRLQPDALRVLLPWRAADVFAIASQIEFADRNRRREETGYTVPVLGPDAHLELHDLLPPDACVRGHLYGGGGATLFQTAALRRYLPLSGPYAPFYFEDADWAMQAWAEGLCSLHCPASRAIHEHRGTIGRFVSARQIEHVVQRNLAHFRWRYGDLFQAPRWHGGRIDRLQAWLRGLRRSHRQARQRLLDSPVAACLQQLHLQRYPHAQRWRPGKPRVLLVSPFTLLPPAHGGARRVIELARASADEIDWILLHDEAGEQALPATADDGIFRQIHPVGGRPDSGPDFEARWSAHAHPRLRAELARLIAAHRPDAICFEHLECLGLIEQLDARVPLLWTLHDAGRELPETAGERVRAALRRVQALLLTTPQDLGHWPHDYQQLIENGVRLPAQPPLPSPDRGPLLLLAPLRYGPNLQGLQCFLEQAWPSLSARYPWLRLRILGGVDGARLWGARPLPASVDLIEGAVDPAPHYEDCLLALNPQGAIEGSAIKIAEALAHGRVMVSTMSGARGYESLCSAGLLRVPDCAAMVSAIVAQIDAPERRRRAEAQATADIAPWSWAPRAERLRQVIEQCIVRGRR